MGAWHKERDGDWDVYRGPMPDEPRPVEGQRVVRCSEFMQNVILQSRQKREMKLHFFGWPLRVNAELPQNVICIQPSEDPKSWKWFRFEGERFEEFELPQAAQ